MTFDVWAPRPKTLRLQLDGRVIPMQKGAGDWWSPAEPVDWTADAAYGYLIDDDPTPRPDPRSRRQPDGVHGLSRTVELPEPQPWPGRALPGAVLYELHIGTFTPEGTLDSAIERLDHLVELGVDFVEVLPVNAFNGVHNWGYDGVLWYAVQETYGGPAAYLRFVDACHARGLAVVQDVVYNHLGPSGNYLPLFARYLDDDSRNTWGDTVNLDGPDSDEVRRYIVDNALMWLRDYGVDALRLDAVHALLDEGETHLLKQLATEVDALAAELGRPLTLIAESDLNDPKLISPRTDGGYGLTAQWSDDYHHAAHVNLSGETAGYYADFDSLAALAKVMTRGYFHDGTYSSFRERDHGFPIDTATMPTWRLVTFTQDHDQIGNRAVGDRLSATLDERVARRCRPCSACCRRSRPCCSWGRSGARRRRGSSSRRIPSPNSARRPRRGASPSSRRWAGIRRWCQTRRIRRRSPGPSCSGTRPARGCTRACSTCTGGSLRCGATSRR